jgi:hypothetical protein
VSVLRPSEYKLLASSDGKTWRTLATVNGGQGTTDTLQFPGARASFVRLESDSASTSTPLIVEELTATG